MRLSVNLIANQTFFPMESEVPDDVVPKAIAAKYRLAPGQGAMRPAEPGRLAHLCPASRIAWTRAARQCGMRRPEPPRKSRRPDC